MKPEQLKKLAEAMGKDINGINEFDNVIIQWGSGIDKEFSAFRPDTNPAQLLEVFLWTLNQDAPDGEQITMEQFTNEIMGQAMKEIGE